MLVFIMKKNLLFLGLAAGMLLASCSKTSVGTGDLPSASDDQKLLIGISSGSNSLTVKGGRPLLSQAPGQDIQNIKLYFVKEGGSIALEKTVTETEWANAVDYDKGKAIEVSLKKSNNENLADGKYTVYAVGYSTDETVYTLGNPNNSGSWKGDNFYVTTENEAEEIFAGEAVVYAKTTEGKSYLTSEEDGDASVILNRQVAGVTGYFTNIPAEVAGVSPVSLRLVASNKMTKLIFKDLYGSETTTESTVNYVTNGSDQVKPADAKFYDGNDAYVVYDMKLSDWFKYTTNFSECDLDKDGYVGYKDAQLHVYKGSLPGNFDNWSTDKEGTSDNTQPLSNFWVNPNAADQQLVAGSVFAGKFVIPFQRPNDDHNTLELQLMGDNNVILKIWNVAVPEDEVNDGTAAVPPVGGVSTSSTDLSMYIYNIYRNHMYSLGSKGLNVPDDGGDGEDPDPDPDPLPEPDPDEPDPDDPQDLNTAQDLLIHVNDQWEIIHDMVID